MCGKERWVEVRDEFPETVAMTWPVMAMGEPDGGEGSVGEPGLAGWVGKWSSGSG